MSPRPPLPPFTEETARQKVQAAEDAWNTRDPERVAGAYTEDSVWRNRDEFLTGRAEIIEFLRRKWARELDYALRKDLWSFHGNRIAVRFQYESHDADGQWFRSYGNELWEFDEDGLHAAPGSQHQRRAHRRGRPAHLRAAPGSRAGPVLPAALTGRGRADRGQPVPRPGGACANPRRAPVPSPSGRRRRGPAQREPVQPVAERVHRRLDEVVPDGLRGLALGGR